MEVAIVADDVSGAADSAAAFARAGRRPVVLLDPRASISRDEPVGDVVACSAGSRDMEPAAACRAIADAVARLAAERPQRWFKKIDSTLRGHIGRELAVVIDRLEPAATVVCPAFPSAGRIMRRGRTYVHGTPLEQTPLWPSPAPAWVAHLPTMLAANAIPSVAIGRAELASGELERRLRSAEGGGALVVDAVTEADLDALAVAGLACRGDVLWVGSAGLAAALAGALGRGHAAAPPPAGVGSTAPVLVVVGSMAGLARRQLDQLARSRALMVRSLSSAELSTPDAAVRRSVVAELAVELESGGDVAVVIDASAQRGSTEGAALADRLGELVADLLPRCRGLVLTGGDTARAVLAAGGIRALRITGNVQAGVCAGTTMPGGWHVVTKAGSFGDEDTLSRSVGFLRGDVTSLAPLRAGAGR